MWNHGQGLLDAAQLKLSDEEFELYTRIYPTMRVCADSLYIPETRYEEPALIFDPPGTSHATA